MIHLARPTVSPVVNIVFAWNLFCFESRDGRTNGRHVQKQRLWVGLMDQQDRVINDPLGQPPIPPIAFTISS